MNSFLCFNKKQTTSSLNAKSESLEQSEPYVLITAFNNFMMAKANDEGTPTSSALKLWNTHLAITLTSSP